MKTLQESIIGRKGVDGMQIQSIKDLHYGDVIEIDVNGNPEYYVYMPLEQITDSIFDGGGFVRYDATNSNHFVFWESIKFDQSLRYDTGHNFVATIIRKIKHIGEWSSISRGNDIKKLFNKYHIPIVC